MSGTRDPWLAANLSWSFAGLGQFYAGRKIAGALFLSLEILLWATLAVWALFAEIPTIVLGAVALQGILWIVSARSAFLSIPSSEPSPGSVKSPWKSVFFTRFIPGTGHLYARKWYRGPLMGLGMLALLVVPFPERVEEWRATVFFAVRALILMDSYLILRRDNLVPRTATVAAMVLILAGSQSWILPMVLKRFVVEVYKIPSSAMEPTLMGEASSSHPTASCPFSADHANPAGDRIVASKLAYVFRPIERFDVAIFRFPLNQSQTFVKRVVGLPNEEIQIHDGDLYVRRPGEQRFRIVRKPAAIMDDVWIRPSYASTGSPSTEKDLFSLSSGMEWPQDERMGTVSGPNAYRDSSGTIVGDVKLAMEFSTGARSEIAARVVNPRMDLELMLATGGRSRLVLRRPGKDPQEFPLDLLQTNRTYAYDLIILDGKVTLRRDAAVVAEMPFIEFIEDAVSRDGYGDLQAFGARGGQTVIRKVDWSCDKHYRGRENREHGWGERQPLKIPEDSYLFLGDNVPNSHDSRAWVKRTFTLKDGRQIVAEAQMVNEGYSPFNRRLQAKLKTSEPPDIGIDGDQYGDEVGLTMDQIASQSAEPFRFVDRKFITGRVLKVWWPLQRARPVR